MKRTFLAGLFLALAGLLFVAPAEAVLTMGPSGICPQTIGHAAVGTAGVGNATDCNLFITFNADGSITTTPGPQATYESIEDALIGVTNNTGTAITAFHLSGTGIGGFDGDGINVYTNGGNIPNNVNDTTGYGGLQAWFTNNTGNDLDVNFIGGIPANGGTAFFSLEEPALLNLVVNNNVPEPASLGVIGLGTLALGVSRRRRAKRSMA